MSHPNSLALEAFACGEPSDTVAAHLETCSACQDFVGRLRGLSEDEASAGVIHAMLERSAADGDAPSPPFALRRFWIGASTAMLPLAAAAALIMFFRQPDARILDEARPHAVPSQTLGTEGTAMRDDPAPATRFKGDVQLAVVRERASHQARFTSTAPVRAGDRLRIEVALDREQVIVGAVFGDDGSYLELMPAGARVAGTHFSERSVRVDEQPIRGTIAVGSPEAMAKARATSDFGGLTTLRLDVEGDP